MMRGADKAIEIKIKKAEIFQSSFTNKLEKDFFTYTNKSGFLFSSLN